MAPGCPVRENPRWRLACCIPKSLHSRVSQNARTGRIMQYCLSLYRYEHSTRLLRVLRKYQPHALLSEYSEDDQYQPLSPKTSLSPSGIASIHLFKAAGISPCLCQTKTKLDAYESVFDEVCSFLSANSGQPPRFCRMSHH